MHKEAFSFKAISPITHGEYSDGVDTGNIMLFRRMPILSDVSGKIYSIPCISGNAMRGIMRRLLARELFAKLSFKHDKLYIALANGGALEKTLDQYIVPEKIAKTREMIPMLSVFGTCLYTYMLSGKMNMSFSILRCSELGTGEYLSSELISDIGMTRHIDKTEAVPGNAKPMPYMVECVIAGTVFDSGLAFNDNTTSLERACVFHGLNLISTVGGKSGSGFGTIEMSRRFDDEEYISYIDGIDEDYSENVLTFAKGL